jgi:FK506-binding protein 2
MCSFEGSKQPITMTFRQQQACNTRECAAGEKNKKRKVKIPRVSTAKSVPTPAPIAPPTTSPTVHPTVFIRNESQMAYSGVISHKTFISPPTLPPTTVSPTPAPASLGDNLVATFGNGVHVLAAEKPEKCRPHDYHMQHAARGARMLIRYSGSLADGTVFDSSPEGLPYVYKLGKSKTPVKGFEKGLLGMCIGERRTFVVGPKYGYGAKGWKGGLEPVPPNAALFYHVYLIKFMHF